MNREAADMRRVTVLFGSLHLCVRNGIWKG
jgi:hypothetical protein